MRAAARLVGLGLLLPGLAGPAAAQVRVLYVAPERFTDAENRIASGQPLRATLAEMTRILEDLGRRRLGSGESLEITVLDIDLAGFEEPGPRIPTVLRVVRDSSPPRIRLAYVLRRGGRVLARGEETLTDINFLLNSNPRFSSGPLYYERALLRDWFARRFPG
ncbi:DUF3016 domain-containing protein [Methylobacterium nigriterrae]|uniref:DUF3016 domain-containing protein n=1 Tax=Methylobacterium nigriterrae TaxID=3127512 RepID=UPI003013824A